MAEMTPSAHSPFDDSLIYGERIVRLTQPFLIGRAHNSYLRLQDPDVSRRHAMLFLHGADWWLSDLGSRNGVRVNGMRLTHTRRMRDGDELRIGKQNLAFASAAAEVRRTTGILEETTQVTHLQQGTGNAPVICELIVSTGCGEILEGDKAARWFFGNAIERPLGAAHSLLPTSVRMWLSRQSADEKAPTAPLELIEADRRVVVTLCRCNEGRYFLLVREESQQMATERLKTLGLTAREAEVMHWVCEGKTNPEIALILGRTVHTVNRHLEHIFTKLNVDNRQRAIVTVMERLGAG